MSKRTVAGLAGLAILFLAVLYPLSLSDFLLFHSLVETFTVLVSFGIFVIAWHTRAIAENRFLAVMGTGFLYVGLTTMLHTLAYKGMGVFPGVGANLATQLWVLSRVLEVATVLVAGIALIRPFSVRWSLAGFGALCAVGLATIFVWPVFPVMYVDGVGLSPMKTVIEYVLMVLLGASLVVVWRNRRKFEPGISQLLLGSIVLMIATEYSFTLYIGVTGIPSFVGHYFALMSFLLIYRALVETSLRRPFALLFRELKETQLAEHDIAEVLQSALVSAPDRVASVDFGYAFQSATIAARVGGDFFDLYAPSDRHVAFVIGDVCGKGIAATAATAMLRTTLRVLAYENPEPAHVLARANGVVRRQLSSEKFITLIYGVIDSQSGVVVVGAAGHPDPVMVRDGRAEALELPSNPPLGVIERHEFSVGHVTLAPGDTLMLYTDGCIDAGPHHDSFGIGRVIETMSARHDGPRRAAHAVLEAASRYAGGSLSDDVAVIGIRFAGAQGSQNR